VRPAHPAPITSPDELALEVRALGLAHGLDAIGIASAEPLLRARAALEERKAAGLHAGMDFTYRRPVRSTTPSGLVEGAAAIVVGARRHESIPPPRPDPRGPYGAVARYAWTDNYGLLKAALGMVAAHVRRNGYRARVLADDNGLVDREVAHRAGLGWFGKNANLLRPGAGSWFVLGSVVTSAPLPVNESPVADRCGACRRCIDGCPTAAIVAPGVIDAGRCLAWLVQAPGTFPRAHREALGARIYGCDDCQEVCPPNQRADAARARARPVHARSAQDGPAQDGPAQDEPALAGPASDDPDAPHDRAADRYAPDDPGRIEAWVSLLDLLEADDETLLARHGRWYIAGRDPRWLRRNALIAVGNVADPADPDVAGALVRYLGDRDPMLRAHAVWACRRLGRDDLLDALAGADEPEVAEELAAPPPTPAWAPRPKPVRGRA
jgi:epoxyqueuosine reductase